MDASALGALVQNAALLLALAVVYEALGFSSQGSWRFGRQALTGVLLGLLAIAVMISAWMIVPGLIFDTRSVILGVGGLFFGTVAGVTAAVIAGAYRLGMGGPGAVMGVTVIVVSVGIGLAWRHLRRQKAEHLSLSELYLFGVAVHVAMLAAMVLLPGGLAREAFSRLAIPVMLVYPLATAFVGWLLAGRHARLRAEEALRSSEARYRRFFETHPLPVLVADLEDLRIRLVNDAAVSYTGYSREEFMTLTLRDLVPEAAAPRLESGLAEVRRQPDAYRLPQSWSHRRRDGSVVEVEVTGHITTFAGRRVLVMTAQDLTERNRLADQLRHAQKMEAVGRLAGGVAHDFNNVLQALTGQVELARDALGTSSCREQEDVAGHLEEIAAQVRRAASLPRQLLFFARRETVKPEILDLAAVLADASEMLRRLVREDVVLTVRNAPKPLLVDVDRGQFEQILLNLVVNAVDAMPNGGRLEILIGGDESMVWLEVRDTGHGITAEVRERMFEPFFTTKEPGQGTGLGLTVVRDIVDSVGGVIQVESSEDRGTRFAVAFPRVSAMRSTDSSGSRPRVAPQGQGERILLVEDDPAARDSLVQILHSLNYRVTAAGSGEEALRLETEHPFDLLITDVVLPGLGGMDLALELTRRWPDTRVILVSGYTSDSVIRLGVPSGLVRFLQKPFDSVALAVELRLALEEPSEPSDP